MPLIPPDAASGRFAHVAEPVPRIRFLSAREYRLACDVWAEVAAQSVNPVAHGEGSAPPLGASELVVLARAMREYRTTPPLRRLWRRLTEPPDALPLSEFLPNPPA